jgi:hypothetical protein
MCLIEHSAPRTWADTVSQRVLQKSLSPSAHRHMLLVEECRDVCVCVCVYVCG